MFELRMSQINPTILAIATQVMWAATLSISMASLFAMATVANTITSSYLVAFFAAPVAVSFDRSGAALFD